MKIPAATAAIPSATPARPSAPSPSNFAGQLERAIGRVEAAGSPPAQESPVASFASHALESSRQLDHLIELATQGATFSPQELIALQARVFRCSQTVEVFAKTVDQLGNAAKQTLGTQV